MGYATGPVPDEVYLKAHYATLLEYGIAFSQQQERLLTYFARQMMYK